MSVSVKSNREIELMREAGKILGTVLNELSKEIKPGMTTHRIDQLGEEMIRSYGCIPSFLGYGGFPASICVSVNEEVVHGIPSKKRILHEEISSVWMQVLFTKGITQMPQEQLASERLAKRHSS